MAWAKVNPYQRPAAGKNKKKKKKKKNWTEEEKGRGGLDYIRRHFKKK